MGLCVGGLGNGFGRGLEEGGETGVGGGDVSLFGEIGGVGNRSLGGGGLREEIAG